MHVQHSSWLSVCPGTPRRSRQQPPASRFALTSDTSRRLQLRRGCSSSRCMPSIVRDAAVTNVSGINAVHATLDVGGQLVHEQQMRTPASTVSAAAVDADAQPAQSRTVMVDSSWPLAVAAATAGAAVDAVEPIQRVPPPPQQSTSTAPPLKKRAESFFSRLLTHLDPLRLHAGSGALYLVLSTGAVLHVLGHTLMHGVLPHPLHDLLIPALFVVSLVMNCSGFQLAFRHRRGVVQRVFYASALVSTGGHLLMWYFDTSFPASIMARRLARAAFVAWMPFCVWFGLIDPLVNMTAILDSRGVRLRDRMQLPAAQQGGRPAWPSSVIRKDTAAAPASPEGLDLPASGSGLAQLLSKALSYIPGPQRLLEYCAYGMPMMLPGWITLVSSVLVVLGGDGMAPMLYTLLPHLRQAAYSWGVLGQWAGVLGTFAATLRDRNLINRRLEMAMVGLPFATFVALIAFSLMHMDDAWALVRVVMDPVYVMQAVRMAQAAGV